ncbi:MAG: 50S ribosomal protein L25 [Chloroflexia bacterium]|nr:50S ribosomal protein L25 [Chloroflexia bacterium]
MADELILRAEPRTVLGKQVKRLRREGLIPGVVYGPVVPETVSVSVDRREFEKLFYQRAGHSTLVSLQWDGRDETVLIREVQTDPVKGTPLHIDFFAPNLREKLRTMVPVVLHNASPDAVGVLNTVRTEVELEGLPRSLPHQIDADISRLLDVGDVLHVSDLTLPRGVDAITDGVEVIANLVAEYVEPEPEVEAVLAETEEGAEAAEGEAPEGEADDAPSEDGERNEES